MKLKDAKYRDFTADDWNAFAGANEFNTGPSCIGPEKFSDNQTPIIVEFTLESKEVMLLISRDGVDLLLDDGNMYSKENHKTFTKMDAIWYLNLIRNCETIDDFQMLGLKEW